VSEGIGTLALRLTDAQIAAIRLRNERRKKSVGGTGEIDLGDISSEGSIDPSNASDAAAKTSNQQSDMR
jgi:hypothetical protein